VSPLPLPVSSLVDTVPRAIAADCRGENRMTAAKTSVLSRIRAGGKFWLVLEHSARTAIAAVVSVLVARLFRLPEAYWAPITTLVITQSSLGAALTVSRQRFAGTAIGAALSALVATYFEPRVLVFGACVFLMGFLCVLAHLDRSAYRFGGVTLAIVLLIPKAGPVWMTAFHRFAEVSIGIAVALLLAILWPEQADAA
jgi:uncharacterized membrane protein YgaE (UPF0421/DUF939 family)